MKHKNRQPLSALRCGSDLDKEGKGREGDRQATGNSNSFNMSRGESAAPKPEIPRLQSGERLHLGQPRLGRAKENSIDCAMFMIGL